MTQITKTKRVWTWWIKDAPAVATPQGEHFFPVKVELCGWKNKAYVQLTGLSRNGRGARSVKFNLNGTNHPPCPEWVRELLDKEEAEIGA